MRLAIVNVNLQYPIPDGVDTEAYVQNLELPEQYISDSLELVKVIEED